MAFDQDDKPAPPPYVHQEYPKHLYRQEENEKGELETVTIKVASAEEHARLEAEHGPLADNPEAFDKKAQAAKAKAAAKADAKSAADAKKK